MATPLSHPLLYWGGAVLVTLGAAGWLAARERLSPWTMLMAGAAALPGAVLGAKGYARMVGPAGAGEPTQAGGAVGVFAGAAFFAWLLLRLRGTRFLDYGDAAAPAVALGYALYRIGCHFNGCCFGTVTDAPWAVTFGPTTEAFAAQFGGGLIPPYAEQTLPVHPAQIYHAAAGLAGCALLLRMKHGRPGLRLSAAFILYGVTRFAIECVRGDARPILGPLDANQLACIVLVALGGLLRVSHMVPGRPADLPQEVVP
ncbi:MAG TPA: prolipoprotein diacylglyceryl transferase family protein [bacterium]